MCWRPYDQHGIYSSELKKYTNKTLKAPKVVLACDAHRTSHIHAQFGYPSVKQSMAYKYNMNIFLYLTQVLHIPPNFDRKCDTVDKLSGDVIYRHIYRPRHVNSCTGIIVLDYDIIVNIIPMILQL